MYDAGLLNTFSCFILQKSPQREAAGSSIPGNTHHLSSYFSPNSSDDFTVRQHSQASFDANSPIIPSKMVSIPLI